MGYDVWNTYYTQSTSFDQEGETDGRIRLTHREKVDGKRRFNEVDASLLERSGPIQIGPSEAMYLEFGLVKSDDGKFGIAYQAKDALGQWSGWELSEEIGVVDFAQARQRLQHVVGETDTYSGAGRGTGQADPEGS